MRRRPSSTSRRICARTPRPAATGMTQPPSPSPFPPGCSGRPTWSPDGCCRAEHRRANWRIDALPRRVCKSAAAAAGEEPMSSEELHVPREALSQEARLLHYGIVSLKEELDAADWYRQRADDTEDETLREILLH